MMDIAIVRRTFFDTLPEEPSLTQQYWIGIYPVQVVRWFTEQEKETGLPVCRVKNGFTRCV
jgi:hypothetical protein